MSGVLVSNFGGSWGSSSQFSSNDLRIGGSDKRRQQGCFSSPNTPAPVRPMDPKRDWTLDSLDLLEVKSAPFSESCIPTSRRRGNSHSWGIREQQATSDLAQAVIHKVIQHGIRDSQPRRFHDACSEAIVEGVEITAELFCSIIKGSPPEVLPMLFHGTAMGANRGCPINNEDIYDAFISRLEDDPDLAENAFKEAVRNDPMNNKYHNSYINFLGIKGDLSKAGEIYREIVERGLADQDTYANYMKAAKQADRFDIVSQVFLDAKSAGFVDRKVFSIFIEEVGKKQGADEAEIVFKEARDRGLADVGIFCTLFKVLGEKGSLEKANCWFEEARKVGLAADVNLCNEFIDALVKLDDLRTARAVFEEQFLQKLTSKEAYLKELKGKGILTGDFDLHGLGYRAAELYLCHIFSREDLPTSISIITGIGNHSKGEIRDTVQKWAASNLHGWTCEVKDGNEGVLILQREPITADRS